MKILDEEYEEEYDDFGKKIQILFFNFGKYL
jgi:hypothetical protein